MSRESLSKVLDDCRDGSFPNASDSPSNRFDWKALAKVENFGCVVVDVNDSKLSIRHLA